MRDLIKILLRENLEEADLGPHSIERMKTRLDVFSDTDISMDIKKEVIRSLDIIRDYDFPMGESYGVMLGGFKPNPKSEYFQTDGIGKGYYGIMNPENNKYSYGNQFWVIIRDNVVGTFMLRKGNQKRPIRGVDGKKMIKNVDNLSREPQNKPNIKKYNSVKLKNGGKVRYYLNASPPYFTKINNEKEVVDLDDIFGDLPEKFLEDNEDTLNRLMESNRLMEYYKLRK